MSFETQSVADPKAVKALMARFNTDDGYTSLIKAAGNVIQMDKARAVRFIELLGGYCQKQPLLLECTPASLWGCMKMAAQFGLEPGLLGMLYIVPFKNHGVYEAQVILGYRGLIELCRRSKAVKHIEAFNVYEADLRAPGRFEIVLGLKQDIIHIPNWRASHKGQKPLGSYCISTMSDDDKTFTFMSAEEIEAIRSRSRAKDSGPWVTDPEEMYRKTVVRRHCKYLPVSVEDLTLLDAARDADFDVEPEDGQLSTRGGIPISTARIEVSQPQVEKPVSGQTVPNDPAPTQEAPAAPETQEPQPPAPEPEQQALPAAPVAPVAGTQGMKEAIARKRGRPKKKSGAEVPPPDVPVESANGASSPNALPTPAPEAPAAAKTPEKMQFVHPDDEKTTESVAQRILRYRNELTDKAICEQMPTEILTARVNYCWGNSEADHEKIIKMVGMKDQDDLVKNGTLHTRKAIIIAAATLIESKGLFTEPPKQAGTPVPTPPAKAPEATKPAEKPTEAQKAPEAPPNPAAEAVAAKIKMLLEGYEQIELEPLRARAKEMVAFARQIRNPDEVKAWLYDDLMIEADEDLDVCRHVGLRRLLVEFGKKLTAKPA